MESFDMVSWLQEQEVNSTPLHMEHFQQETTPAGKDIYSVFPLIFEFPHELDSQVLWGPQQFSSLASTLQTEPSTSIRTLQIRQARKRSFETIFQGMEMNSLPYKYRVRISGLFKPDATVQLQLILCDLSTSDKQCNVHLANSLRMEKVKWLYGSTEVILEAQLTFLTQSWAHGKNLFCLRIVVNHSFVFESAQFELLARRNRKRCAKLK